MKKGMETRLISAGDLEDNDSSDRFSPVQDHRTPQDDDSTAESELQGLGDAF